MKTTKRLIGLLLTIVMVVGMLPLSVLAAEVAVTTTGKTGQLTNIGGSGELVGIPEGVTTTYLSDIYNTDAKVYNYVVPGGDGAVRDFVLDQNFFGTRVYPFTAANDSNRFGVTKGASNLDADGYRTLNNDVKVHYTDIVLGRNTTIFEKGLAFQPSAKGAANQATVIFDISELNADYFYAVAGMTGPNNSQKLGQKMDFNVYGSKATEYSEDMEFEKLAWTTGIYCWVVGEFNVPVTGYNYLKLEAVTTVSNASAECVWADAAVYSVHDWQSEVTTAATCTTDGVITYTCANEDCGETYTEGIPATGHSNGEGVVTEPTCEETGYTTYTCTCGASYVGDEVAATGHSFTNFVAVEGTNYELAECDNGCGQTRQKFLPYEDVVVEDIASSITYLSDLYNTDAKLDHFVDPEQGTDWAVDENFDDYLYVYVAEGERYVIPAPNSTEDTRELNNGVTYHRDNIALGVNGTIYEKGLSVRPSDVKLTEQAYVTYDISGLNADRFYAVVGMVGEGNNPKYTDRAVDFELWAKVNAEDVFVKLYSVDGIRISNTGVFNVDISGYNYIKLVAATAGTDDSGTSVAWGNACVYSLASENDCEHNWGEGVETTAPTCTTAGVMTYTCTVCENTKTVSIMPNGEHSYESKQTKAPTCNEPGEVTYTCTACGDSYTEDIDPTGEHKVEHVLESCYNTDSLANAGLTETQKGYATVVTETNNILEKGTGYAGTTLSLKENILLNIVYQNATIDKAAYAVVSFTDHYGNEDSTTIQASEFQVLSATMKFVQITSIAVADGRQPITVELYDAEGNVLSTTVESVESYIARNPKPLHDAIMAFCVGAYNYFPH